MTLSVGRSCGIQSLLRRSNLIAFGIILYVRVLVRCGLNRYADNDLVSVESVGILPPVTLLKESLKILIEKCERVKASVDELMTCE